MSKFTSVVVGLLAVLLVVLAVWTGVRRSRAQQPADQTQHQTQPAAPELVAAAEAAQERIVKRSPASSPAQEDETQTRALSAAKIGWGPGIEVNDKNQTVASIAAQEKYGALGACFILPADEKKIYLTFDLGYENGYTASILDTLAQHGVKATFFITMDYVKEQPDIVARILAEGHTLGNHTVKHPSMPDVSDVRARSEVMELHNYILEKYGYKMTLFRFPMGEFSAHSLALLHDLGYESVFWSFAYRDWVTDDQPAPAAALKKVTGALHGGGIYLLHAVSATNAAIMDDFLTEAQAQGYTFALLDQRLGLVPAPAQSNGEGILP